MTHLSVKLTGPNQPIRSPVFLCLQLYKRMEMTHEVLQDTVQQMSWPGVLQGGAATGRS